MVKVYQKGHRGCFQACLASILELPLARVPDFCKIHSKKEWLAECVKWLKDDLGFFGEMYYGAGSFGGYYIGTYKSGDRLHAMVMLDGEVVHDPLKKSDWCKSDIIDEYFIIGGLISPSRYASFVALDEGQ